MLALMILNINSSILADEHERISSITNLPIIYYTPETKLAGGGLINLYYYNLSDTSFLFPSTIIPYIVYTLNNQHIIKLIVDQYFDQDKYHFAGEISYINFPDLFYGIGKNTKTSQKDSFTQKTFVLESLFQKKLYTSIDIGLRFNLIYQDPYKYEPDMQLV